MDRDPFRSSSTSAGRNWRRWTTSRFRRWAAASRRAFGTRTSNGRSKGGSQFCSVRPGSYYSSNATIGRHQCGSCSSRAVRLRTGRDSRSWAIGAVVSNSNDGDSRGCTWCSRIGPHFGRSTCRRGRRSRSSDRLCGSASLRASSGGHRGGSSSSRRRESHGCSGS